MTTIQLWIFEDDDDYYDSLVRRIEAELSSHPVHFSYVITRSKDGKSWSRIRPTVARGTISDQDLLDKRCDAIVLDMSLKKEQEDISTGMNVLKRLAGLDGGCRNILVNTGFDVKLRTVHWAEFDQLLTGKLLDRVAFWEKGQDKQLVSHIITLVEARSSGVRLPAHLITRIRNLSFDDDAVLLLGETGAGKEHVARSIHDNWAAAHPNPNDVKNNFIPINCAGLTEELVRGELFGVVCGSFTGANLHTLGRVLRAAGLQPGGGRKGSRSKQLPELANAVENCATTLLSIMKDITEDLSALSTALASLQGMSEQLSKQARSIREVVDDSGGAQVSRSNATAGSAAYFAWLRRANTKDCTWNEESLKIQIHPFGDQSSPRARGTLFLDEIGAMSTEAGRVLLRFLNDWEVAPVGFEGIIRPEVKVPLLRVIGATNNRNWMNLAKSQLTDPPEWADLFYRLSRGDILHISPPGSSEVEALIEEEKRESGATDIEWDTGAIDELRGLVKDNKVRGNRREIRAISRRAMQIVRGSRVGIPVADPRRVTRRELLLACRLPGEIIKASPSAVNAATEVVASSHQSHVASADSAERQVELPGPRSPQESVASQARMLGLPTALQSDDLPKPTAWAIRLLHDRRNGIAKIMPIKETTYDNGNPNDIKEAYTRLTLLSHFQQVKGLYCERKLDTDRLRIRQARGCKQRIKDEELEKATLTILLSPWPK
jgi:DNA-binding NtrC family response regulator